MKIRLKKVVWMIACGIVVLTAASTGVAQSLEKSLPEQVAELRRELRAQGIKTELADFNVKTDADTRARANALICVEVYHCWVDEHDHLDFLPRISDDTSKVIWKDDWVPFPDMRLQWPDLRARLQNSLIINRESFQVALDRACVAAGTGPIRFEQVLDGPDNTVSNEGHGFFDLSEKLATRTMFELHDGHPAAAWTNLFAMTHVASAWEASASHWGQVGRQSLMCAVFSHTWQALQFTNWPDAKLAALQQEWQAANFFTNFPAHVNLETLTCVPNGYYRSHWKLPATCDETNKAWSDEKDGWLYVRSRTLEMRRAVESPTWSVMRRFIGSTNLPPRTVYVDGMLHIEDRVLAGAAESEARRRLLITAIALERYRGKHGTYPAGLATLVPEFLKTVPVDFMDGKPLRYRLTSDGHFVLYSVGLDCVDDGGKMRSFDSSAPAEWETDPFHAPTKMDLVWPRPAIP